MKQIDIKKHKYIIPRLILPCLLYTSETIDNTPIFYNRRGDYSVIIKCENPIIQYSADMDAYYDFHHLFTSILKGLGTGYTIQKQDILCKKSFLPPQNRKNDYLSNRYFEHFKAEIHICLIHNYNHIRVVL